MCKFYSRFSLAVAIAAFTAPVSAADYDPPMVINDAPQYVPVEVGSGWYLRGDISYAFNESEYDVGLEGAESENNRFGGGIGIGYHFNDLLRADFNLAYISDDEFSYVDIDDAVSVENRVIGAFVNGYLDLGTVIGFTPYVGAGAGMVYAKHSVGVDSATWGAAYSNSDRQYGFAYTLNAGVNYQVSRNMSLDVGYQYLSAPGIDHVDVPTGNVEEGLNYHQLRVGLRYDLW